MVLINYTFVHKATSKELHSLCVVLSTWSRQVAPAHHADGPVHSVSHPPSVPQSQSAIHAADLVDACSFQDTQLCKQTNKNITFLEAL